MDKYLFMTNVFFPSELNDTKGKYPFILFSARAPKNEGYESYNIALPIPPSVAINSNGEYATVNLSEPTVGSALVALGAGSDKMAKLGAMIMEKIASKTEKSREALQFGAKAIVNPNTNTTFKGNSIREFAFDFSLIASSPTESRDIKKIREIFQRFTYAARGLGGTTLTYPPVWTVKLYDTQGVENPWYPKFFASYLTGASVTSNPEINSHRPDGAPVEIQLSLSFRETRMLTREDIDELEKGTSDRGVDDVTGIATF
jgi:hypothetical protein